jgi:hypothetical protein
MLSFTLLLVTELHSGETCSIVPQFYARNKRQLELWMNVGIEFHVVIYLKITNFDFYVTSIIFINVCSSKQTTFSTHIINHNTDTRQRNSLYLPQANLTVYQKAVYYSGIKILNNLPLEIKNVAGNQKKGLNCSEIIFVQLFIL